MLLDQHEVFADFEGDRWFARNKQCLCAWDPAHDLPLRLVELYRLRPRTVIEVGASNGFRMAAVAQRYGAKTVAVELSDAALRDGQARFPDVQFVQAGADALPVKGPFDLVIVNFVFHWLDRARLLRAVAEIDRVLADRGYLIIGDFAAAHPTRMRYHHLPDHEVYTYKQDYAAVFLASGLYQQVAALTGDHAENTLRSDAADQERIAAWLLRKRLGDLYVEGSYNPREPGNIATGLRPGRPGNDES